MTDQLEQQLADARARIASYERFVQVARRVEMKLHAANRPEMRNGLRQECRDLLGDALVDLNP